MSASHEDVVLEICGPRSNKTSALVVPAVLSAPGPVITTSNKVDAYTLTVHGRTQLGRVFVLDPQHIARVEQEWWWNPLRAVTDMASATQLATHFIATVVGGHDRADPYFTPASARLLAQHLLAAALAADHSLRDVRRWLATRAETRGREDDRTFISEMARLACVIEDRPLPKPDGTVRLAGAGGFIGLR